MLKTGILGRASLTVTGENTARAMGSGALPVLATPAVGGAGGAGRLAERPAGAGAGLRNGGHPAGSGPQGCHAGGRPGHGRNRAGGDRPPAAGVFRFTVTDGAGLVADGTHERFVITNDKFLAKAEARGRAGMTPPGRTPAAPSNEKAPPIRRQTGRVEPFFGSCLPSPPDVALPDGVQAVQNQRLPVAVWGSRRRRGCSGAGFRWRSPGPGGASSAWRKRRDHAVQHGGGAVHNAAVQAVGGVGAPTAPWGGLSSSTWGSWAVLRTRAVSARPGAGRIAPPTMLPAPSTASRGGGGVQVHHNQGRLVQPQRRHRVRREQLPAQLGSGCPSGCARRFSGRGPPSSAGRGSSWRWPPRTREVRAGTTLDRDGRLSISSGGQAVQVPALLISL